MKNKLGVIVIGESPRPDCVELFGSCLCEGDEVIVKGALDGLSDGELERIKQDRSGEILVALDRDLKPISVPEKLIKERIPLKIRERAAVGGISQALELGEVYLKGKEKGAEYCVKSVCEKLGGKILGCGTIEKLAFNMSGGFDVGELFMTDKNSGKKLNAFFWNEYMGAESDGERLATFPDLIMTFSADDGTPVVSADLREGMGIYLIAVDKALLNLGYGLKLVEPYADAETATGREIIKYLNL